MKKINLNIWPAAGFTKGFSGRYLLLFIWLMALGLSSCEEKECVKPRSFCGTGSDMASCNTYVTVKSAICGVGIWGNLWLQLENGEFLQPWESPLTLPATVKPGQRLKIRYEVISRDNRYANVITCMAVPPASQAIRITCIEEVEPVAGCGTEATVIMDSCFPAYWGEVSLQLANGDILRPWEGIALTQSLQNGQRVKVGYEVSTASKNYQLICNTFQAIPDFTPIKVTCLEELSDD